MTEKQKNKQAERPLVPRLRFPEFRGKWQSLPMSAVYSIKGNNSLSRDKLNYTDGSYRNIHYGDIHTKFAQHFRADVELVPYINDGESHSTIRPENYCMAGDMVFADASEDMTDIGKAVEVIDAGDVPLVSGLHTILARPNEGAFALGFGAYLFSSPEVRKKIQRESQGAKVLGLSATRLGNVQLYYPRESEERKRAINPILPTPRHSAQSSSHPQIDGDDDDGRAQALVGTCVGARSRRHQRSGLRPA